MRRFDDWKFVRPGDEDWNGCYDQMDKHSFQKVLKDDYYKPMNLIMLYNYPRYSLLPSAGSNDSVIIYRDGSLFYIYTYNERYDYAGVQIFKFKSGKTLIYKDEYFFQNMSETFEDLPKPFFDYSTPNQIKMII